MNIQVGFEGTRDDELSRREVVKIFSVLVKHMSKFDDDLRKVQVRVVKRARWGYKVSFDMQLPGKHVFAEEKGDDVAQVARRVRSRIERQLEKYLAKLRREGYGL